MVDLGSKNQFEVSLTVTCCLSDLPFTATPSTATRLTLSIQEPLKDTAPTICHRGRTECQWIASCLLPVILQDPYRPVPIALPLRDGAPTPYFPLSTLEGRPLRWVPLRVTDPEPVSAKAMSLQSIT